MFEDGFQRCGLSLRRMPRVTFLKAPFQHWTVTKRLKKKKLQLRHLLQRVPAERTEVIKLHKEGRRLKKKLLFSHHIKIHNSGTKWQHSLFLLPKRERAHFPFCNASVCTITSANIELRAVGGERGRAMFLKTTTLKVSSLWRPNSSPRHP